MAAWTWLPILAVLAAGTHAQLDSIMFLPLSNIPPSAEGIETQYWFPEHTSLQFPAGDTVEAVVGLHSSSPQTYNISSIFGSLNNHLQFSTYFYNFTPQAYTRTIRPGEEISLSFPMYVPYNLPPREFQVALTVFYAGANNAFHGSTFFNKTVDVVEKHKWVDTELLFLWMLLLAAVGGLGYVAYSYIASLGYLRKHKAKRAPKRPLPDASSNSADEWLKGTNFAQGTRAPRKSTSKGDVRKASPMRGATVPTQ